MRLRPSAVAIVTSLLIAGCGSSSHSTSTVTPSASSSETTASSPPGLVASTETFSVSGEGPAVTTTITSSATTPPEVPKTRTHRRHSGSDHQGGASQGAHVEPNVTIKADGDVSTPVVSVPSGVGVQLRITNRGSSPATVALGVPSHPSVKLAPGASGTLETGGLKDGTYRILVNGNPRGQLTIGAQGGP